MHGLNQLFFLLVVVGGLTTAGPMVPITEIQNIPKETRMCMIVGEQRFAITLADNDTARAFATLLPLSLDMTDLYRNEKYAHLPQALPTNASQPRTIHRGDIMLYGQDTLVVFYETFKSSYSYTRLGYVDAPDDLAQALGRGKVRIIFPKKSPSS